MSRTVTDSITQINTLNIGTAIPLSMGLVSSSMASSVSLLMFNATFAQKNAQAIENASVTQCCALMISVGAAAVA